jgi:hypothetical protein
MSIKDIMNKLGHDHIDLLKMDVEGAERDIIPSIFNNGIQPNILCVEIDEEGKQNTIKAILNNNYKMVSRFGKTEKFTFIRT